MIVRNVRIEVEPAILAGLPADNLPVARGMLGFGPAVTLHEIGPDFVTLDMPQSLLDYGRLAGQTYQLNDEYELEVVLLNDDEIDFDVE